jgi:hypothetical protein
MHYKVSRSLIEMYPDTMLARLISEEWRGDVIQEVFIDRDGTRFQYVLDYMRDQKVHLAMNVSKDSILMELEYFGFANVDGDSIDNRKLNNRQALENILQVRNQFLERLTTIEKNLQEVKVTWVATKIASMVYDAQLNSKSSSPSKTVVIQQEDLLPIPYTLSEMNRDSDSIKSALTVVLSDYGISVSSVCHYSNYVNIEFGMDPAP